jgi:hypothetical protein
VRYIDKIGWHYINAYIGEYRWSLAVTPSTCGRNKRLNTPWQSWEEVVEKTPWCAEYDDNGCSVIPWNKEWNISRYWSMYNQYVCHIDFAWGPKHKEEYNLDPWREDKGYHGFVKNQCNGD